MGSDFKAVDVPMVYTLFVSDSLLSFRRESKQTAIDNIDLLDEDGKLKLGLKEGYEFEIVPMGVWEYFVHTYGGGPAIVRESVAINCLFFGIDLYPITLNLHYAGDMLEMR
jgi:hypothetical protein